MKIVCLWSIKKHNNKLFLDYCFTLLILQKIIYLKSGKYLFIFCRIFHEDINNRDPSLYSGNMCAGFPSSSNRVPNAQNSEETVRDILQIIARTFPNSNNAQNAQMPVYNFQANRYIQHANYNGLPNNQTNKARINAQIKEKTDLLDRLKNLANSITTLMMLNPTMTTPDQKELKEHIRQTDQLCQKVVIQRAEQRLTQMQQMVSQQVTGAVMHAQQPALFRETNMLPAMNVLPRASILPQPVVRAAQNTSFIQAPLNYRSSIPASRTTRTISSTDSSQTSSSRSSSNNIPLAQQKSLVFSENISSAMNANVRRAHNAPAPREILMSEQFLKDWKAATLCDQYRDECRERYTRIVYSPDFERQANAHPNNQQRVVENTREPIIETVKKYIDACKPGQNIWHVVLNLISFKGNKYAEFDTIYENREMFSEKLNQFVGYYDGFFKDLVAYMRQQGVVVYTKEENTKILNKSPHKLRISDIYMKKSLNVEKMKECIHRSSVDFKLFPLINRIRTILSMPEVYENLTSMPYSLFEKIVESIKATEEKSEEVAQQIEIIKSLGLLVYYEGDKLLKTHFIPFSKNLLQCFHNAANDKYQDEDSPYALDKIYLKTYEAVLLFL